MPAPVPATVIRARLLPAMAHLTAEKGYAAVTIDDLARAARISKRTFYAQFADKEACLLAAYEDAAELVYRECERAARQAHAQGWRTQVDIIISTYLRCLAAQPAMTRVFHVEIQAAGARALELHLAVNLRYAKLLRRIVPPQERPDQPTAIALLGAVNELVLHAVATDRTTRLPRLQSTVRPLFDAALGRNLGT
ncbi:TetR/AcrR family transcriptional regulator [Conexibacter woesei]|uniref:TetR/AcrR family transcriptional regulator n=1 Tax=Conexibacter woesei TaxID=191495 RepID=UPI0009DB87DF|nr:TetR/AcrR family transcriptional regulator [Conexibacter woesei]